MHLINDATYQKGSMRLVNNMRLINYMRLTTGVYDMSCISATLDPEMHFLLHYFDIYLDSGINETS